MILDLIHQGRLWRGSASGPDTYQLPAAAPGLTFGPFAPSAGFVLSVTPTGADQFATSFISADAASPVGAVARALQPSNRCLRCAAVGSLVTVRCVVAGQWEVIEKIGPWAVELL